MNTPIKFDDQGNPVVFECKFYKIVKLVKQNDYLVLTEKFDVNAAVVIAQDNEGRYLLARLNRKAVGKVMIEFPRGGRENGENTEETARREFREETGYAAESALWLGKLHSNTSLIHSAVDVYLLKGAHVATSEKDGEVDSVFFVTKKELLSLVRTNEISDAHTLSAISMLLAHEAEEAV